MAVARYHPGSCRVCGAQRAAGAYISATGLCPEHANQRVAENITQIREKSGPFYDHWARRSFMAARKRLLANVAERT